ncbi:8475_t:CDS:2, partial [Funneliformis geosporum]
QAVIKELNTHLELGLKEPTLNQMVNHLNQLLRKPLRGVTNSQPVSPIIKQGVDLENIQQTSLRFLKEILSTIPQEVQKNILSAQNYQEIVQIEKKLIQASFGEKLQTNRILQTKKQNMPTHILYKKDKENNFKYIVIKDHANFAEKGQDIVCAAISAITNGTINFLQKNYQTDCQISYLSAKISIYPRNDNPECQLCLRLMLYQLENIANSYPAYLKIEWDEETYTKGIVRYKVNYGSYFEVNRDRTSRVLEVESGNIKKV